MEHTPKDCPQCRLNAAAPALLGLVENLALLAEAMEIGTSASTFGWLKIRDKARAAILAAKGDTS